MVVIIDYFTKWVEAETVANIIKKNISEFVWKSIFYRLGIPRVLITDNGRQFNNAWFYELCSSLGIRNHFSSLGHP